MSFWNEAFYFEKRGDRYVYRPTAFSAGYDITADQKDRLFAGLKRLQWRTLVEGFLAIAVIAAAFMSGVIETQTPIPWFMVAAVLAVAVLALSVLRRRDRLIEEVLGHRTPDVPRPPLRQTLTTPRPMVGKRFAIPVLRSVVVLFALALAAVDVAVAYLVVTAYRARGSAEGAEAIAAAERIFALTVENWQFWAAVVGINAVLIVLMATLIVQLRSWRSMAEPE